jgi:hypothetical protein
MAADLVEDPTICQTFVHDIESAFFLLLWMSIRFVKSNWDKARRSNFINSIFQPQVYGGSGGSTKVMFMQSKGLESLEFTTNVPLALLLRAWQKMLSFRHVKPPAAHAEEFDVRDAIRQGQRAESASKPVATNESSQKQYQHKLRDHELFISALQNHNAILTVLDTLLRCNGWPDLEPAERQSIILSHVEKQFLRSSSKRCREAAAESEGTTLPKRSR